MTNTKLTKLITATDQMMKWPFTAPCRRLTTVTKSFLSLSLTLCIIIIVLLSLNFAWLVASPLNESPLDFSVYNVQTKFGYNWMLLTIKMVTNDPILSPNPSPVTSEAVTPAGLVMDPPLFLEDPIIPGINFLQNIPFFNQFFNFLPVQILTPPILGGLGNLTGLGALVPLATQLAHNVNPTIIPGAGFNAPPVLPTAFWPTQGPLIPNPILDPNLTAGIAGATSSPLPAILLGSSTLIFFATGWWAFYKKKAAPSGISENISPLNEALRTGKPLKYSLPADDPLKNFNQLYSFRSDKIEKVGHLQIELVPDFSVKILGFAINLNMIPLICVTGSLKETLTALFLALLRRVFVYCVRQQIAGFWKVLIFGKVKNAHLRFSAITLTKNLSKIRLHSQNTTIKTKIVILYTAHQISPLLKRVRLSGSRMG